MGCGPDQRNRLIHVNIPLLIFIFAILLQLISLTALATKIEGLSGHIDRERSSPSPQLASVVVNYKLHNRCSEKHVSVEGRKIRAKASQKSQYAWFRVESYSFESTVTIRSNTSHSYLCFSPKGRLTVRQRAKGKLCLFKEKLDDQHYTQFQSVQNKDWYIGFNGKGNRMAGNQWKKDNVKDNERNMTCYQFTKREHENNRHYPFRSYSLWPPNDASRSTHHQQNHQSVNSDKLKKKRQTTLRPRRKS